VNLLSINQLTLELPNWMNCRGINSRLLN